MAAARRKRLSARDQIGCRRGSRSVRSKGSAQGPVPGDTFIDPWIELAVTEPSARVAIHEARAWDASPARAGQQASPRKRRHPERIPSTAKRDKPYLVNPLNRLSPRGSRWSARTRQSPLTLTIFHSAELSPDSGEDDTPLPKLVSHWKAC